MALSTAQTYITEARRLVQDTAVPYRYSDAQFLNAMDLGFIEIHRIRPDAFFGGTVPTVSAVGNTVTLDPNMKMAMVYFLAGHISLSDDEPSQDTRGAAFLQTFRNMLTQAGT